MLLHVLCLFPEDITDVCCTTSFLLEMFPLVVRAPPRVGGGRRAGPGNSTETVVGNVVEGPDSYKGRGSHSLYSTDS